MQLEPRTFKGHQNQQPQIKTIGLETSMLSGTQGGWDNSQTWRCHLQILYQKKESHYSALLGAIMNKLLAYLIAY